MDWKPPGSDHEEIKALIETLEGAVPADVDRSRARYPIARTGRHRVMPVDLVGPSLHLGEDQQAPPSRDKVDFTHGRPMPSRQDAEAFQPKVPCGDPFGPTSAVIGPLAGRTITGQSSCSVPLSGGIEPSVSPDIPRRTSARA